MLVDPQAAALLWDNSQEDNHLTICSAGSVCPASGSQFPKPLLVNPQAAALFWEQELELQD